MGPACNHMAWGRESRFPALRAWGTKSPPGHFRQRPVDALQGLLHHRGVLQQEEGAEEPADAQRLEEIRAAEHHVQCLVPPPPTIPGGHTGQRPRCPGGHSTVTEPGVEGLAPELALRPAPGRMIRSPSPSQASPLPISQLLGAAHTGSPVLTPVPIPVQGHPPLCPPRTQLEGWRPHACFGTLLPCPAHLASQGTIPTSSPLTPQPASPRAPASKPSPPRHRPCPQEPHLHTPTLTQRPPASLLPHPTLTRCERASPPNLMLNLTSRVGGGI